MLRFVGREKSESESACVNDNPMRARLHPDKSADSQKSLITK